MRSVLAIERPNGLDGIEIIHSVIKRRRLTQPRDDGTNDAGATRIASYGQDGVVRAQPSHLLRDAGGWLSHERLAIVVDPAQCRDELVDLVRRQRVTAQCCVKHF